MQTFTCETGGHEWERPSQRGRPPRNCPDHTPERLPATPRPPREGHPDEIVFTADEWPGIGPDEEVVFTWDRREYRPTPPPKEYDAEAERLRLKEQAERRIDNLEFNLKLNGTHISQHRVD